ncbi:MAG TPA: hypothetical protein VFY89_05170 [Ktedonobacterales bacterium]
MESEQLDPRHDQPAQPGDSTLAIDDADGEPQPLARVRYGLGKEILLYPDAFAIVRKEEAEELRISLDSIRRLVLAPGEYTPSKLVLMFDLDDDTTIIAAEGMTNVRDFRKLLATLAEVRPEIALDPPDMSDQLAQALDIRRRHLIGCYGTFFGICLLLLIAYLAVAFIGAHGPR